MTNQYIITEEQIRRYRLDSYVVPDDLELLAGDEVRSHPYNPHAEREKALKKLRGWVEYNDDLFEYDNGEKKVIAYQAILDAIDRRIELRQEGKQEESG